MPRVVCGGPAQLARRDIPAHILAPARAPVYARNVLTSSISMPGRRVDAKSRLYPSMQSGAPPTPVSSGSVPDLMRDANTAAATTSAAARAGASSMGDGESAASSTCTLRARAAARRGWRTCRPQMTVRARSITSDKRRIALWRDVLAQDRDRVPAAQVGVLRAPTNRRAPTRDTPHSVRTLQIHPGRPHTARYTQDEHTPTPAPARTLLHTPTSSHQSSSQFRDAPAREFSTPRSAAAVPSATNSVASAAQSAASRGATSGAIDCKAYAQSDAGCGAGEAAARDTHIKIPRERRFDRSDGQRR